jgi:hypothetical protein
MVLFIWRIDFEFCVTTRNQYIFRSIQASLTWYTNTIIYTLELTYIPCMIGFHYNQVQSYADFMVHLYHCFWYGHVRYNAVPPVTETMRLQLHNFTSLRWLTWNSSLSTQQTLIFTHSFVSSRDVSPKRISLSSLHFIAHTSIHSIWCLTCTDFSLKV